MLRKRAELAEVVWCWGETPLRHELVSRRACGLMSHDGVGLVMRVPEGAVAGLTPFGFSREHATVLVDGAAPLFEDEQAFIDLGALTLVIRPVVDPLEGAPRPRLDLWRHRWLATSLCLHAVVISMFALRPSWTVLVEADADYASLRAHLSAAVAAPPDATEGPRSEARLELRAPLERASQVQSTPRATTHREVSGSRGIGRSAFHALEMSDYPALLARAFQGIGEPAGSPYDADAIPAVVEHPMFIGYPDGSSLDMRGTGRGAGGGGAGTLSVGPLAGMRGGLAIADLGIVDCAHGGRCGGIPRLHCGPAGRDPGAVLPCSGEEVMGSLSRESIRRVVRARRHEIRFCYERRLATRPGLSGRIALRWVIAPEGRVSSAVVEESELGDPETERCVEQAVRRWSYPRSEGATAVRYAYVFQDGEDIP